MEPLLNSGQEPLPTDPYPSVQGIDAAKKERHRMLVQRGLRWLCAGALLMGSSFALNIMFFHTGSPIVVAMYVLTSLGAVCVVKSLVDILGF